MRHTLIFISTFIFLVSCQTKNNSHSDTFQILLPDTPKTHRPNDLFKRLTELGKHMSLPSIDSGVNGLEIRLWTNSMIDPDLLIILHKSDTSFVAQQFDYFIDRQGIAYYKPREIKLRDTLQSLMDSLNRIDFTNFISQEEMENFHDNVADGLTYYMEISTSKYYKLLSYHCPEHFAKNEPNNKMFLDIVLLLDRYLHFYSPICSI